MEEEMETVWEHGITKEETLLLFDVDTTRERYVSAGNGVAAREILRMLGFNKEQADEYLSIRTIQRICDEDIYKLYIIRGNEEMAQKYLDRIQDDIDN
jgi:hypothetical protein